MSTGALVSFHYYRGFDLDRLDPHCPLIADSGAFSAHTLGQSIERADYADWLDRYPGRFDFAFNLDVIGDSAASFANWEWLREERGHDTTPVVHWGTPPGDLQPYLDAGAQRLALGGLVGSDRRQGRAWSAAVFRWLRDNGHAEVPVHGLGVHLSSRVLADLPWATTDSSTFTMAWRFARLRLWTGKRWVQVNLDGRSIYRYGAIVRSYGFEPEEVAVSTAATRSALVRLATRIECRAARDWEIKRSRLPDGPGRYLASSAPTYMSEDITPEARRYLADTTPKEMKVEMEEVGRYLADTSTTLLPHAITTAADERTHA